MDGFQLATLSSNTLYPVLRRKRRDLEELSQNWLEQDCFFASFCSDKGIRFYRGDEDLLWRKGWLRADKVEICQAHNHTQEFRKVQTDLRSIGQSRGKLTDSKFRKLYFHPFRLITAHLITDSLKTDYSPVSVFSRTIVNHFPQERKRKLDYASEPKFLDLIDIWNGIADLTILLEPLYWPGIVGSLGGSKSGRSWKDYFELRDKYRKEIISLVSKMDFAQLRKGHEILTKEAYFLDKNRELYLLLRCSNWSARKQIAGKIGGALWIRHVAEVFRRGVEDAFGEKLLEEDRLDQGYAHIRIRQYGTERPLDFPHYHRQDVTEQFGLSTAIKVRWYVEGATEVGFLRWVLGGDSYLERNPGEVSVRNHQVEILDMKGEWGSKKAVKFLSDLRADIEAERFSYLMIDDDNDDNTRMVKRAIQQGCVIGMPFQSKPDFELNFTSDELVDAAILFDSESEMPINSKNILNILRSRNYSSGKEFQKAYINCHGGKRKSLKSERWGRCLAEIFNLRNRESNPLNSIIASAFQARKDNYRWYSSTFYLDPDTMKTRERPKQNTGTPIT